MRLLCQTKFQILIVFVAATFMCSTGCKSQRGFPKLADLAWWQKDDARLAETLPPAAHFDPEPAIQMQAAGKNSARDEVAAIVAAAAKQAANNRRATPNGQPPTHPIRTPYSLESAQESKSASAKSAGELESASETTPSSDNSFASTAGQIKTKLPDWESSEGAAKPTSLDKVQQSLTNSLDATKSKLEEPSKTSDVMTGSTASADDSWRTDFALPANSTTGLNANIEAARKSLNRAEENTSNEFAGFKQSLNNSFDRAASPLTKLAEKATEITEQVAQSTEFQPNPPYVGLEPAQPTSDNSQSELARIQIAAKRFQENADQLQKLADQARQQAEELSRQVSPSSTPVTSQKSGQMAMQNQSTLPGLESNGSQPLVEQAADTPQLPANSLRNPIPNMRLNPITQANSSQDSAYPSTPHGNYAPKGSVSEPNSATDSSQASFYGATNSRSDVVTASGGRQLSPIPVRSDSSEGLSTGDVIVPDTIRVGNSNFAPGSVNQLIPTGK